MKVVELFSVYQFLTGIKTGNMKSADTLKLVKTVRNIKKVLEEFEALRDEFNAKEGDKKEMEETLNQELMKEVEVSIEKLSEEAFNAMVEGNDLSVGQILLCEELLK